MSFEAIYNIAEAEAQSKAAVAEAESRARAMLAEAENEGKASVDARRRFLPWAATVAIAASLVLIAAIGLYHRQNNCYILAYGQKSTDPNLVLNDMTATLEGVFGEGEDVGDELFDLFNPAL